MRKIAYIELDTHAEIALNFMELMADSESFSVDYFFSEKISKQIGKKDRVTIIQPKNLPEKIKAGNYDLVIIGTAHRYFDVFNKIADENPAAIIVHNLNFSKISKRQLIFNLFKKDTVYRLKLLLKEGLLSAPEVYRKANMRLVLDENMASDGVFLPVFFTKFQSSTKNKIPKIVVPGEVSNHRRDYAMVLKEFVRFRNPFELVLLGKATGLELSKLSEIQKNLPDHLKIRWFTEKVPSNVFEETLSQADILWCPLKRDTEFFSQREIYGETKMSGNVGDAIKYGKMAVFPAHYHSHETFIIQQKYDVEEQFLSIMNVDSYDFEESFNQQKVLQKLECVLSGLV